MKISHVINESLADWGNDWVHFSRHPMLTVNPNPHHMDPLGIYFFPASHIPKQIMWNEMPYRYQATIAPDARILDVGHITPQQIQQLVAAAGIEAEYTDYTTRYPPKDIKKAFDQAWELLQRHYYLSHRRASFNSMIRALGYQAIFDDTGAIHSIEPQLLVLDRRIITSVRLETRKGSGYADMQKVLAELSELGSQFGRVKVGQIKKPNRNTYYTEKDNLLNARLTIDHPDNSEDEFDMKRRYISFNVYIQKQHPDTIRVSVYFSHPQLGYGAGADYSISHQQWEYQHGLDRLRQPIEQVLGTPAAAVAEVKKLPGPRVAGSGKDFRQNAGTNRSGKQPGRLMGSGKPMKVKPGFVG